MPYQDDNDRDDDGDGDGDDDDDDDDPTKRGCSKTLFFLFGRRRTRMHVTNLSATSSRIFRSVEFPCASAPPAFHNERGNLSFYSPVNDDGGGGGGNGVNNNPTHRHARSVGT